MTKKYSSKPSWASDDDASNLLGSILDDTRDAALAETKELAQAVEAKRQADISAKRQVEEARRADTASRLEQEAARQVTLEKRRTAAMQAITAADAPEQIAEPIPIAAPLTHHPSPMPLAALPEVAVEPLAPIAPLAAVAPEPAGTSGFMYAGIAATAVVFIGAAALLAALLMPGYTPDHTPYPKIVMHPVMTRDLVTGESFRPVPEDEPPAAIAEKPDEIKKPKRPKRTRPATTTRPKKPKKPSIDDLFGDDSDDIFGTMDKSGK